MRLLLFALLPALVAAPLRGDAWRDAIEKLRAGDEAGATQLLRGAIEKEPAAVRPNVLLTEVLLGSEHIEEARAVAAAALAKDPKVAEFHRVLGDVEFRQGYIFEAEKDYKEAFKIDPKNTRCLLGIARVYETAGVSHKAELLVKQAHNLDADDPMIESALESFDRSSPAAIVRMEDALKGLGDTPENANRIRDIKTHLKEARKLAGKPANELASPYTSYQIPLALEHDGQRFYAFGVPIAVNDAKGELELDTGASGFLISSRMAERGEVERLGDVELSGIGNKGGAKGWLGYAHRIQIGDVEFRNCIVRVAEKGSVTDSGGLIGTDVFRRFLVKLNFRAHRIELAPLPGPAWDGRAQVDRYTGPELKEYAQFLRLKHYVLIPTRISDGPPVLFMLDTGAAFSMISTNAAPSVTKLRNNASMRVKGISGEVKMVYSADKVTLEFAGFRQLNQNLTAFDLTRASRSAGAEITGIMGLPLLDLFASITLDYRDGRIRFDYQH